MTAPDQPSAFVDQSGQWVDIQYNADTIEIVNHLTDGTNGKRCPTCGASPMRRTQAVWSENTRRSGSNTVLLTNTAFRVAPPRMPTEPAMEDVPEPEPPEPGRPGRLAGFGLLAFCASGLIWWPELPPVLAALRPEDPMWSRLIFAADVVWVAAVALSVQGLRRRRAREAAAAEAETERITRENDARAQDYHKKRDRNQRQFSRWKRSWFCMSCTAIVVESSGGEKTPSLPRPDRRALGRKSA